MLNAADGSVLFSQNGETQYYPASITKLMTALVAAAKVLGSGSSSVIKGSAQMVVFAGAIKMLASACIDLAQLDFAGWQRA